MLNYTVFENHSYNDDSTKLFGGATYICQTFTPGTAHTIYVIQMKLLRVGACGTVTLNLYATDSSGKPTGASLATATVAQATVDTSESMIDFTLTTPYVVNNEKLAIVLSAAGILGTIRARYKNTGEYVAGGIFSSTDSGTTWTETELSDFIFAEWGLSLPIYDAVQIQLYPRGSGSYTQLQPIGGTFNFSCVSDLADAPNEEDTYVCYNIFDRAGFLSGESESVAGTLTGTSAEWRTQVDGLWGVGTAFESDLVGKLLTSPTPNTFYQYNHRRIAEVDSVESTTALTLKPTQSGSATGAPKDVWWFTPRSVADADTESVYSAGADGGRGGETPLGCRVGKKLTGTWHFDLADKMVRGIGGNAMEELRPYAWVRWDHGARDHMVDYVVHHNEFYLYHSFGYQSHEVLNRDSSDCIYSSYSWIDDLTDKSLATMWTTKTKSDSYLIKKTQITGSIRRIDAVFRCAVTDENRQNSVKIATYNSSDEDRDRWPRIDSTYLDYLIESECPSLCATLTDVTGAVTGSPVEILKTWEVADEDGVYPRTDYYPEVTTEGEFQLVIESGHTVYFAALDTLSVSGDITSWFQWLGEGTYNFTITGTGTLWLAASAKTLRNYTDAEIAIATWQMMEKYMNAYNVVTFCPGTWKIYRADACAGNLTQIGNNPTATSGVRYDILAVDCDGSNDEVQWNIGLQGYNNTMVQNNVSGYVLADYVVAGRNTLPPPMVVATAKPFLVLNGVTSSGTEEVVYIPKPITNTPEDPTHFNEYQFITFTQSISRPGGGIFTIEDFSTLEVGITLGGLSDFDNIHKVICTQLYLNVYVSASPWLIQDTVGLTQYGFKTFNNRMDEWGLPVFSNGMNMLTHKIYRDSSTPFFARPIQILRGITSRILGRRRTSSSPLRVGTSGSITQ